MLPPKAPILIYDGRTIHSGLQGDIRINNYNNLKSDFQNYIDTKMGDSGKATIVWDSIDNVHAYIISL
jgi:hypothetical protein